MANPFSAEAIIGGLIKSLGISQDDIRQVAGIIAKLNAFCGEIDAFKSGTQQMVAHFNRRFDALETRLTALEKHQTPATALQPLLNGTHP